MLDGVGEALERALPPPAERPSAAVVVGGAALVGWVAVGLVVLVQIVAS